MTHVKPITINRHSTQDDRQSALRSIYAQVLERQPYAWERQKLAPLEKDFLTSKIGVRRFIKELSHSDLYLDAFYYRSSNPKFIEICVKHFLGRAIQSTEEMHRYTNILIRSGVVSLMTAILDSEEYRKHFGCFTVPYRRNHDRYESPNAYLETNVICEEHYGRRGWSVPTLYWHQLGLHCDEGICAYDEEYFAQAATDSDPPSSPLMVSLAPSTQISPSRLDDVQDVQDDLMELLWSVEPAR